MPRNPDWPDFWSLASQVAGIDYRDRRRRHRSSRNQHPRIYIVQDPRSPTVGPLQNQRQRPVEVERGFNYHDPRFHFDQDPRIRPVNPPRDPWPEEVERSFNYHNHYYNIDHEFYQEQEIPQIPPPAPSPPSLATPHSNRLERELVDRRRSTPYSQIGTSRPEDIAPRNPTQPRPSSTKTKNTTPETQSQSSTLNTGASSSTGQNAPIARPRTPRQNPPPGIVHIAPPTIPGRTVYAGASNIATGDNHLADNVPPELDHEIPEVIGRHDPNHVSNDGTFVPSPVGRIREMPTSLSGGIHDIEEQIGNMMFNPWSQDRTSNQFDDQASEHPGGSVDEAQHVEELQSVREARNSQMSGLQTENREIHELQAKVSQNGQPGSNPALAVPQLTEVQNLSDLRLRLREFLHQAGPSHYHEATPADFEFIPAVDDFFHHHVVVCDPQLLIEADIDCKICELALWNRLNGPAIETSRCGHRFHETCLQRVFRSNDEAIGYCPACSEPLCSRSILARIQADRSALFGTSDDFPERNLYVQIASVDCQVKVETEEGLAAVMLRVLKDHVQSALDEEWKNSKATKRDLNWYSVVRSAGNSFKNTGIQFNGCKFIPDHETLLTLLIWTEVGRVVGNVQAICKRVSVEYAAQFFDVDLLRSQILDTYDQYLTESAKWTRDDRGYLLCEVVVEDSYRHCMGVLHTRHRE